MSEPSDLETEVRALQHLDLEGLQSAWSQRWETSPTLRSPELLRHILAWRIQAEALGGLDAEMRRRLRSSTVKVKAPALRPGVRLTREWKGERHEVEVVEGGYAYAGAVHKSLSPIARAITGARWNGPRFFGMRRETQA